MVLLNCVMIQPIHLKDILHLSLLSSNNSLVLKKYIKLPVFIWNYILILRGELNCGISEKNFPIIIYITYSALLNQKKHIFFHFSNIAIHWHVFIHLSHISNGAVVLQLQPAGPTNVPCDFEATVHQASLVVFPGATINGRLHHLTQVNNFQTQKHVTGISECCGYG